MRLFNLLGTTYDNFENTMKSFLIKVFSGYGQTYSESSIYGIILQGIKGVMQNIMFYIEDAMTEQNVFTAIRKKSVYSLAKISGYDAWYGSSAVGTVYIKNKIGNGLDSGSVKIIIPNHTVITNTNTGYDYILWMNSDCLVIDMNRPLVAHDIKIVQGRIESAQYISKGEKLETFDVSPTGLFDAQYIEVKVNNEKCEKVTNIYDMTEGGHEVVVTAGFNGGISIMFGDNVHGTKLNEGDTITVSYIIHNGSYGNVDPTNIPNLSFKSALIDGFGNELNGNDYLTLTLTNYISGGSDSDTVENVKKMIGCNSRSLVLASEDNFKLFISRYSFISTANILMHKNSLTVSICPVSLSSNTETTDEPIINPYLSDYQKNMILTAIEESKKTFAGLTINIIDPIIRKYGIICYVKADSEYKREVLQTNIVKVVKSYFASLPMNTQFIAKSSIINEISNKVDGFSSIDIDIVSNDNEKAKAKGYWYKHEIHKINEKYKIVEVKQIYDDEYPVGLDYYGNISLNSLLELPILSSGVIIYPDEDNSNNSITMQNCIEFHFI